jgi:FMN phosphatase YigB (HAD superfamily)
MTIATAGATRRTQGVSAVSFDVFDTFLLRACTTPDGVFERAYELSGISDMHPNASEHFVQHRIQAEARARKIAKRRSGSAEVRIADIYACFPHRLFGLHLNHPDDLAAAEFRAELELCRANPDMLAQYSEMKGAGHRVGFISDTYWSSGQLGRLLLACSPGLSWDFLYASCDHGSSKSESLFATYLSEQDVDAAASFHIGASDRADIGGARRHGIHPRQIPQAGARLSSKLHTEATVFKLLCPARPARLDHGARTLRRLVAAQSTETSTGFQIGMTVVGPLLAAFDAFIDERRARLVRSGRRVAIGFLGPDGFLSYRIWRDMRSDTAAHIEISRRVALIGAAASLEALAELLRGMAGIDAPTFTDITRLHAPEVARFFAKYPDGIAAGDELAEALPDLIGADELAGIASGLRKRLLAYLRLSIPGFDSCTDLVLAGLGHSAGEQKALRRIFDIEGLGDIRLHGAYLLSLDDAYGDIDESDSAEGLISDLVVTPHVKQIMIRNVALLEQICSSGEGQVSDYRGAEALREADSWPADQLALAAEIQSGVSAFNTRARDIAPRYKLQPYATLHVAARWAAASLARLLLLPDRDELALLGCFTQDARRGIQATAPMLDDDFVKTRIVARGLAAACTTLASPRWLAGSLAMVSPSHSFLYVLFGTNHLPSDIFGETACGTLQVGLFQTGGSASVETITVFCTGTGDIRLRIPITRAMAIVTITLPLGRIAHEAVLDGVVIQTGDTVAAAATSMNAVRIDEGRLVFTGIEQSGCHYRAADDDGCLMIPIDQLDEDFAVYTISLRPLGRDHSLPRAPGWFPARSATSCA